MKINYQQEKSIEMDRNMLMREIGEGDVIIKKIVVPRERLEFLIKDMDLLKSLLAEDKEFYDFEV